MPEKLEPVSDISPLETEIHELKREIEAIRSKLNKETDFETWLKIGGALIALLTVAIGLYQFNSTVGNGFRKTVWTEQYSVYQEACKAAAEIAVAAEIEDAERSRKKFWRLYWGRLSILEHPNVAAAMVKYGKKLKEVEANNGKTSTLEHLSYQLARECRKSLQETWNPVDIGDLDEQK